MTLRPDLDACVQQLLAELTAAGELEVGLNRVASALGTLAVSAQEIDAVFARLEARGIKIAAQRELELLPLLKRVVAAAKLRRERGIEIDTRSLADELGVPEHSVRAALLLARTFG